MKSYTIPQLADLLGCNPKWLYRQAAQGRLPVIRIGRLVRVPEPLLRRWMEAQAGRIVVQLRPGAVTPPAEAATAAPEVPPPPVEESLS